LVRCHAAATAAASATAALHSSSSSSRSSKWGDRWQLRGGSSRSSSSSSSSSSTTTTIAWPGAWCSHGDEATDEKKCSARGGGYDGRVAAEPHQVHAACARQLCSAAAPRRADARRQGHAEEQHIEAARAADWSWNSWAPYQEGDEVSSIVPRQKRE
jgi:hypothetical protein